MTRIDADLNPPKDTAALLDELPDLGLFRVVAHAPALFGPWLNMGGALLQGLELHPALRELAIVQTAVSAGCDYERVQHEKIALGLGVDPADIERVVLGRSTDPTLLAVDEFVRTRTLTSASFTALLKRLGKRQTIELLLVVGYYVSAAMLIAAVDLDLDDPADMAVIDASRDITR